MTMGRWTGIAATLALVLWAGAPQADCDWQLLGEREVDHRADHDTISVSGESAYSTVQLRVKGAPVEFEQVTVYFKYGPEQVLQMRDEIEAGGRTRDIDLRGERDERVITRVTFNYRTEERGEHAVVQLWGMT